MGNYFYCLKAYGELFHFRLDGAFGESRNDNVTRCQQRSRANTLAVLKRDTVSALQEQFRVLRPDALFQHLQAMTLTHHLPFEDRLHVLRDNLQLALRICHLRQHLLRETVHQAVDICSLAGLHQRELHRNTFVQTVKPHFLHLQAVLHVLHNRFLRLHHPDIHIREVLNQKGGSSRRRLHLLEGDHVENTRLAHVLCL